MGRRRMTADLIVLKAILSARYKFLNDKYLIEEDFRHVSSEHRDMLKKQFKDYIRKGHTDERRRDYVIGRVGNCRPGWI